MTAQPRSARPLSASLLAPKGAARPAHGIGVNGEGYGRGYGAPGNLFDVPAARESASSSEPHASKAKEPAADTHSPVPQASTQKKAAFTFRMTAQRHFRLRLLSAHQNRSSQRILEEALDAYLEGHAPQTAGLACPCFQDEGGG